ncbi:N-acetyltransferase domain-containing protein [Mycena venus]|uniref:N-acetyltransferase domain-containing protein n=1 Tax=Mycena venus TaxID=2733690 RepID=A0A8H6XWF2_9AGAR|nr:N-acetyltransferase domain-containing protein [Mycena venus]
MTLPEASSLSGEEKVVVLQHGSAADFLAFAYPTLRLHEHSANIVLAHALVRAAGGLPASSTQPTPASNFWLTVWSQHPKSPPVLDIALSCIESPTFGNYPVFVWTPAEQGVQAPQWLDRRIGAVAGHLQACVAPERVFAVFGITALVTTFAEAWTALTGFQVNPKPLYKAFFAVCTPETLKLTASAAQCGARRATMRDLEAAARLCHDFADGSEYPLSLADATAEARQLIDKGQLWVGTLMGEIASICAVTRTSLHVSGITKVHMHRFSQLQKRGAMAWHKL